MKNYLLFFSLIFIIILSSCRDDFETVPSTGDLRFSKDTVYLDTVFTNIGSSTYNLRVYNRSNNDIYIPSVRLAKGESSNYRLNVDGLPGKSFENIEILAKDSMYVFVETTIDVSSEPDPLYTDEILFDNGENIQDVHLVTLVQDAVFIKPNQNPITRVIDSLTLNGQPTTIKGRFLEDSELNFTNEKPYVIYGYAAVAENKTLTIDAGAKVYFHENSGFIIDDKATLKINGERDNQVIIEGDRLEPNFSETPGQWGAIWMRAGSRDHEINYTTIKNGSIGILLDSIGSNSTPTLTIKNSQLYNHSNYGILGRETNILGENVVINNAGFSSLACIIGGTYNFTHSTFANYWNNSFRQFPTVLVNNFFTYIDNGSEIVETRNLVEANFTNCIIYGSNNIELLLDRVDGSDFNYNFKNNLIRFNDFNNNYSGITEYDFTDMVHFQNNILNETPHFKDSFINDLIIGQESAGNGLASTTEAMQVPEDILGVSRISSPDIGAYQHIEFE
jgi:hypothetical protein|tara:strand:+ start:149 stop:1663 length:1515 start_codon:yes stop_codon:yes gene_type:complete